MKITLRLCSLLLIVNTLVTCQEKDPEPSVTLPPTGCDGDVAGTDCQQFFIAAGETLSYPTGTHIKATEGIEINGDIVIDPAAGGVFTLTATSGDIVIAGKIMVKDTSAGNPSGGRYKNGKSTSRLKNGKAADGFTLTLDARGPDGNIILKKGATLFSGRGQHAPDETLASISGYYEGAAGGNGGLIILNAPNGKVILPDVGDAVTQFQDEVFVLGNGGNGANIVLDPNLETGSQTVVEVRGGLGGNAGQLIIDAGEIEDMPALEEMETHPDFIYGGEGGHGGYVIWENAGVDKKYNVTEIILHGGMGGNGATFGGNGGWAVFTIALETFVETGNSVPPVFCYGGEGGEVFGSPLPLKEVWGGDGGGYIAQGVGGWNGGEDKEGTLYPDGADGGPALGQGGKGGDIQSNVRAYQAIGGSGGISDEDRTFLPALLGRPELDIVSSAFGVVGGNGGYGYSSCEGCPGGNGGNAGKATAIGGNGGDVQGEAMQSFGGEGGDIWALLRGTPGNGGNGNPGGEAGSQPPGVFLLEDPGTGGKGTTTGNFGESLGYDLNADLIVLFDGETCGENSECEGTNPIEPVNCAEDYAQTLTKTETGKVPLTDGSGGTGNYSRIRTWVFNEDGYEQLTVNYSGPDTSYANVYDREEIFKYGFLLTTADNRALRPACDSNGGVVYPGGSLTYNFYQNGMLDGVLTYQVSGCLPDFSNLSCECIEIENGGAPYNYTPICEQDGG